MKIVSYSLWGTGTKYLLGALDNAMLIPKMYPGWTARFYVAPDVLGSVSCKLSELGAQVFIKEPCTDFRGLFWRLEPIFDTSLEAVLVRDADSRITRRETHAVKEWEASRFPFHIMRDHRQHGVAIMGGMFGIRPKHVHGLRLVDLLAWVTRLERLDTPLGPYWGADQQWLKEAVWPLIKDNHFAHDDKKRITHRERMFRVALPKGQFVGQRYDEHNNPEMVS